MKATERMWPDGAAVWHTLYDTWWEAEDNFGSSEQECWDLFWCSRVPVRLTMRYDNGQLCTFKRKARSTKDNE